MTKVHYYHCPVCNSDRFEPVLTVKDNVVSGEVYLINQCNNCGLRFTQDVPSQNEIGPYYQSTEYISHSNTNRGILNKAYKLVRKYTLSTKARMVIKDTLPKGKLLDIGAGIGAFLHTMEGKGWLVNGIEPDEGARHIAKDLYRLPLYDNSILDQLPANEYDAITLWHVLEHVHPLHEYVELLKKILKPKGKIFIAVPNFQSLDSSVYRHNWAAYDVPRHLYHFSPASMKILLHLHGLKITARKPMWFDSFYICLISSRYKYGKTKWLKAMGNGLLSNLKAIINKNFSSSIIYIVEKT